MSFLHSIVYVPMGWVIAAGMAGIVLLVLWLSTLLSRRWFVTIKRSEETELIAFHLRRIADAVEQLSPAREIARSADSTIERPLGLPSFGR